jgi:hypothetical protein
MFFLDLLVSENSLRTGIIWDLLWKIKRNYHHFPVHLFGPAPAMDSRGNIIQLAIKSRTFYTLEKIVANGLNCRTRLSWTVYSNIRTACLWLKGPCHWCNRYRVMSFPHLWSYPGNCGVRNTWHLVHFWKKKRYVKRFTEIIWSVYWINFYWYSWKREHLKISIILWSWLRVLWIL